MNVVLWFFQILYGLYFLIIGVLHFIVPAGLPAPMSWMYDLSPALHWFSGAAEILGGLGLLLPSLTRIRPGLTPLAAGGLILVMIGAAVFHIRRAEFPNLVLILINIIVLGFVGYGRWKWRPISPRTA